MYCPFIIIDGETARAFNCQAHATCYWLSRDERVDSQLAETCGTCQPSRTERHCVIGEAPLRSVLGMKSLKMQCWSAFTAKREEVLI